MAIQIFMPALSPTMEEGKIAKWLVQEGDKVQAGDILAEIETDKATMEFEAVDEGIIGKILAPAGDAAIKVNSAIAVIVEEGENFDESMVNAAASPLASSSHTEKSPAQPIENQGEIPQASTKAEQSAPSAQSARIIASPLAKRLAKERGIALESIKGSGPNGRIIRADLDNAQTAAPAISASAAPAQAASPALSSSKVDALYADRSHEIVALDGMRKTIAARLTEAKSTIPHFYLRRSVNLDKLMKLRAETNHALHASGMKISVNDFIIKACALALQDVKDANAVWAGDHILRLDASDIAVAVAIDGGLITPIIRDAQMKGLSNISNEMKDLAKRAKDRKLAPMEYQGGSFSISNLGMFGIENFDAVINPPHGAILAVGAGIKKPIIDDEGNISVATIMSMTLSVDHRVIDGALGAKLLGAIVNYLENPMAMLV